MIYNLDNITPTRTLNLAYIILDIVFLIVFLLLLGVKKRYATIIWSLIGGVIYFIVDYGFFHLISNSRVISFNGNESEAITALVLLWMSFSYGITNFAFIWLCIKKDKYLKEWLILIIMWIRAAYPRFKTEKALELCWYIFIPLAIFNLFVLCIVQYFRGSL